MVGFKAKQVFGTQYDGKLEIPETITPKRLDSLREKVGLERIRDNLRRMASTGVKFDSEKAPRVPEPT